MADVHQIFGRKDREVKYRQNSMDAKSHISFLPRRICLFRSARRFGGFAIRRHEMSQPIRA